MISVEFKYPYILLFLPIILSFLVLVSTRKWKNYRRLVETYYSKPSRTWILLTITKVLAVVLVVVALSEPVLVYEKLVSISSASDVETYGNMTPVEHIVLVDVSKSMSGERIKIVKQFLTKYLSLLHSVDRVQLYVFAADIEGPLCSGTPSQCINAVEEIEAGRRYSAIGDAIVFGAEYARISPIPPIVLVVTDGANTLGSSPVDVLGNISVNTPIAIILVGNDPRSIDLRIKATEEDILLYSIDSPISSLIDDISKRASRETKLAALRGSGEAYVAIKYEANTPSVLLLVISATLLLVARFDPN